MKILEELLTLADRTEYYKEGAKPWPKEWQDAKPPAENKAHDNFKRLLRENDILLANQFTQRRNFRRVIIIAASLVALSWTPLWLPLLKRLAGL